MITFREFLLAETHNTDDKKEKPEKGKKAMKKNCDKDSDMYKNTDKESSYDAKKTEK